MTHETDRERLSALIDAALSPQEAQKLEENPEMAEQIARMRRNDDLLRAAVPLEEDVPAGLLERLGLAEPETNVVSLAEVRQRKASAQQPSKPAVPGGRWANLIGLAAAICVAVIGANWVSAPTTDPQDGAYRTLSSASQPGQTAPNALLVFAGSPGRAEASAIVSRAGGQLVGDKTPAGAWKLAIKPEQREEVLGRLRALPGVTMAEPIEEGTQ